MLKASDAELVAGNFFDETAAQAYVALKSGQITDLFNVYTDGKCYWPAWIHDGGTPKKYGVLRNHMYTMNIQSIMAPGYPEFPNSDQPIAAEAWIQVTIDVEAWNSKDMGDIDLQ